MELRKTFFSISNNKLKETFDISSKREECLSLTEFVKGKHEVLAIYIQVASPETINKWTERSLPYQLKAGEVKNSKMFYKATSALSRLSGKRLKPIKDGLVRA